MTSEQPLLSLLSTDETKGEFFSDINNCGVDNKAKVECVEGSILMSSWSSSNEDTTVDIDTNADDSEREQNEQFSYKRKAYNMTDSETIDADSKSREVCPVKVSKAKLSGGTSNPTTLRRAAIAAVCSALLREYF